MMKSPMIRNAWEPGTRLTMAFGELQSWFGGIAGVQTKGGKVILGMDDGELLEMTVKEMNEIFGEGFIKLQDFDGDRAFDSLTDGVVNNSLGMNAACAFTSVKNGSGPERQVGVLIGRAPQLLYNAVPMFMHHHVCSERFGGEKRSTRKQTEAAGRSTGQDRPPLPPHTCTLHLRGGGDHVCVWQKYFCNECTWCWRECTVCERVEPRNGGWGHVCRKRPYDER